MRQFQNLASKFRPGGDSSEKPTPLNAAIDKIRPAIGMAVFFSFFINILALVSPIYMLQVYDRVLTARNPMTLLFLTLIALFLLAVYGLLEAVRTQVLVRGGIQLDSELREPTFRTVLDTTLNRKGGESQSFRDMDSVREFLTGAGLIAFCDAPWIPVFILVSFILHPYFGILAILAGILIFGLAVANDRATRGALQKAQTAGIAAQNDVSATLRNSEVMRAMGMWRGLQDRWQKRRDELIGWQASASDRGGAIMASIKFSRLAVQTLILGGGAYLAINNEISPGAMIAGSIIVGRALAPIEGAVGQWKSLIGARSAWDRLQAMFRSVETEGPRMTLPVPDGRLSLESASIAPPGAQRPTLINATFTLEPGTCLGVVGPSAAGKSTLVRGIVGVWPLLAGAVRLDGFELRQWDPLQLGRYIGYLPQDVELFSGTVAQNIARFTEFEPEEVIEAARIAGIHEVIQALQDGYETQIGEGGAALSGGQRQRLALARTIFRSPPLIVLDEPNANLDAEGESALARAVTHLKTLRRTVIFVTHKTNLLAFADKILVLQNGQIVKIGERDEVIKAMISSTRAPGQRVDPMVLTEVTPPEDKDVAVPPRTDHRRISRIGLIIVLVTFGVFGGWAAFAPLSSAVIGRGTITVESNRKTIQHLEGGIVRKIDVKEGDQVRAGQVLFELDPVQTTAQLGITRNALFTLLGRADRLTAERDGLSTIRFSPEVLARQNDPIVRQAVMDETLQFQERRRTLTGQTEILSSRVGQLREQIDGIDRQRASMEDQVRFLNEEISGLNELYRQQLVPKPRILALERERASTRGQIGRMIAEKAGSLKAIGEAQLQARQIRQEFDEAVAKELGDVQAQITEYREKYTVAEDVASRIRITSPVSGTAQNLRVFTEGAVVRSAEPLVDVVPSQGDYVIQAQFSPNDVDSLYPGLKAELRFPSFHSRNIPVIEGQVASVSRDRLVDEGTKEPYFMVIINLKHSDIPQSLRPKLSAGMPAEVVVPTGARTALEYLINPLSNALRKTMREE